MPLARYFLYAGGVLLTLLFILDAWFPRFPVAERANANLLVIRIHSDRKWPERIVFDTSLPTIVPPQIARDEGRQSDGAGGTCADATIRCQAATTVQFQKARTVSATQGQDCKEAHGAAALPGSAATAIGLV